MTSLHWYDTCGSILDILVNGDVVNAKTWNALPLNQVRHLKNYSWTFITTAEILKKS